MAYRNNTPAVRPAQQPRVDVIRQLKTTMAQENVKKRFQEVLGEKTPQFLASITNAVGKNELLKKCSPDSIMGAAFVAATYDLPIDSNLGFSAIVPYKNSRSNSYEAQFQLMKKGFIQLAIRSGQYEDMNVAAVYADELKSYNPITGECEFVDDFSRTSDRISGRQDKIVGYFAWFKLRTGFRKGLYMSREELSNHGAKYSQSYRSDLRDNKSSSLWSTNFNAMAEKTVLKRLLSHWGILSIQTLAIQDAIQTDQMVFSGMDTATYADNPDEPPTATAQPAIPENRTAPAPEPQEPTRGGTGRDTGDTAAEAPDDFAGFEQSEMDFNPEELPFR